MVNVAAVYDGRTGYVLGDGKQSLPFLRYDVDGAQAGEGYAAGEGPNKTRIANNDSVWLPPQSGDNWRGSGPENLNDPLWTGVTILQNCKFFKMAIFKREDWVLFRNLDTLGQRAGVPRHMIPTLIVKELVDNALDAGNMCNCSMDDDGRICVADNGDGLPETNEEIADLFSINRPLTSSKFLRLPTRGALGNGLRVVAGAVLGSGGELIVKSCGRILRLQPRDSDGGTDVECLGTWDGLGTCVEISLGKSLPVDDTTFMWAERAIYFASVDGEKYQGKTSPHWYDSASFFELVHAAGDRTIRELVEEFAGCSGAKAGKIAKPFNHFRCNLLTREDAEVLLNKMQDVARKVHPKQLGIVGPQLYLDAGYARMCGFFATPPSCDDTDASIPYIVEAWIDKADTPSIAFYINRTPITAPLTISRCMKDKTHYGIMGCSLSDEYQNIALPIKAGRESDFSCVVNVIAPYMPITTDGKAPNLSLIKLSIREVIEKAIRSIKRRQRSNKDVTQNAIIIKALPDSIAKVSENGRYRYSLRQLFYAVRPYVLDALGFEPTYKYFSGVITAYESDQGHDLPNIYRDDRGILYHPHTGESISLGTRSVERYQRPEWLFNKILYCEKEGFFATLIDAQWPERYDCALLTSKGYASRAARDVVDLLGDTDQTLTFYCIHDADGPGTMIYQTLQEATRARPKRKVKVVNLGLEPAEALKMKLTLESVKRKDNKAIPVADYVDLKWKQWLQSNRAELNAMDGPLFVKWLSQKFAKYTGKLIPPKSVLVDELYDKTEKLIYDFLADVAIRNAQVKEQTQTAIDNLQPQFGAFKKQIFLMVKKQLDTNATLQWKIPIDKVAKKLAGKAQPKGSKHD